MSGNWVYVRTRSRCPHGEIGASVLEGISDRCLSHGHPGVPEAALWARRQGLKIVLAAGQLESLEAWLDKKGFTVPEDPTTEEILDILEASE